MILLLLLQRFCSVLVRCGTTGRRSKLLHQEATRRGCLMIKTVFQHSGSQTAGNVFGGVPRVSKGFESGSTTLLFNAVGKGRPNQRTVVR